jgi:hypothetical protein
MTGYIKAFLRFFGNPTEIYCLYYGCGKPAVDVTHIHRKGMGGTKLWDFIENLMPSCRDCHQKYGDKKQYKLDLYETNVKNILAYNPNHKYTEGFKASWFYAELITTNRIPYIE